MTNDEIVDLMSYINRETVMLELGGGNSTVFLSKFVKKLVTIEHNKEWSKTILSNVETYSNEWILTVVEPNWPQDHPFSPAQEGQFENYVNQIKSLSNESFDVILVDGRDRVRSALASIPKLKNGGILLIHDFWNRPKYHSLLNELGIELIEDSNSHAENSNNTLVAFRRIY